MIHETSPCDQSHKPSYKITSLFLIDLNLEEVSEIYFNNRHFS